MVARRRWLARMLCAAALSRLGRGRSQSSGRQFPGEDGRLAFVRDGAVLTAAFAPSYSERRLTTTGVARNPRWSPDGQRIVFNTRAGTIEVMSAAGANRRVLVSTGRSYQPAWSPRTAAGQRIAFVRAPVGRPGDIWTMPAGGGPASRLTFDGAAHCGNSWPSWSPRNTHLVYTRHNAGPDRTCRTGDERYEVVVRDLRTGARRVTPAHTEPDGIGTFEYLGGRPDFTADGRGVVYLVTTGCFDRVLRYDLATGTQRSVWDNFACESEPRLQSAVPTPSGGLGRTSTPPGDPELGSTVHCVAVPAGARRRDEIDGSGWASIDVQARN